MSAIPHTFTEQNTEQTNSTTTFTAVTGMAQAVGQFVTGKRYLIIATAMHGFNGVSTSRSDIQVVHGSTAFEGSGQSAGTANATPKESYLFMTVWTAVASEGIDLQFRRNPTSTGTATVNFVSLLSIRLDDYLTENSQWAFAERTTNDTLTGSYQTGGSITFTPGTASHDWLVLTMSAVNYSAITGTITTRINKDATAEVLPRGVEQPYNNNNTKNYGLARVWTSLPASSVTFLEESLSTASNVREYSSILAIDLSAFAAHAAVYTEADFTFTTTSSYGDQLQTASITPTVTGDVWMLAYFGFDKGAGSRLVSPRVQLDNSDQPAGQTTYAATYAQVFNDPADEVPWMLSTMSSLSNAAHTIDLDGHVSSVTNSPSAQQRTIMAVTMELAGSPSRPMFRGS